MIKQFVVIGEMCAKIERDEIESVIYEILGRAVSREYIEDLLLVKSEETHTTLLDDIIQNVLETSAWEEEDSYTDSDVRLAIGRELLSRLGVEV